LRPGEKRSVEELLGSLLLVSGNDAASALALGLAGSEETFAQWMNQEARKLGATHSRFSNPHGLPDPHHITTARDMALIARAFWQNPLLRRIAATPKIQVGDHLWVNENKLLGQGGVDGMKTGYTQAAGHTYVASATYRGRHLLVVLLKDTKDGKYQDAQNLFRWGWTHYRDELLLPSGAQAAQVQVRGGLRPFVPLTPASSAGIRTFLAPFDRVTFRVEGVPSWIEAPIEKGETLGTLEVWVNGRLLASYPLVAAGTVLPKPRENARPPLQDAWRRWWSSLVSLFLPSPVLPKGPASSGFSEEMAGNDHLLDLAGAFVDLRRLGIP
ncbi:MAG: hypothetical protein QJR00_06305, partial [Bacillota bacterium]|nr:hypothetical protein [Bacillota bacterium]